MKPFQLALTTITALSMNIQALLGIPVSANTPTQALTPHINIAIFHSPTPTPTPTVTPTPTNTPKPTATATPQPTRTPTPITVSGQDLDRWFEQYSREYGLDRMKLFSLAACESMLRTNAINGPYAGLFQFSASTWISTRQTMGLPPDPDLRFNPEEAIRTAAYKLSVSGPGAWPDCGSR